MPHADPEARRRYLAEYNRKHRTRLLEKARLYRLANHAKVSAAKKRIYYERYKHDPEYKKGRSDYNKNRRLENRNHVKAIEKRCYEKHKERWLERGKHQNGTPERLSRVTVVRAVRTGKLPPAKTLGCVRCGEQAREYHHHKGYARKHWLDVVAVCSQCHKDIHAALVLGSYSQW